MDQCEVCEEPAVDPVGCEVCGRLFGPCCNSVVPDVCVHCVDPSDVPLDGD